MPSTMTSTTTPPRRARGHRLRILALCATGALAASASVAGSWAAAAGTPPAAAPHGAYTMVGPLDDAELAERLRAHVERLVAEDRFSGAIQVTRDGEVVFEGAWGLADRDRGRPNTLDIPYRGGSMNKLLTAVATLQLIQAGQLSLDDRLVDVAAGLPVIDIEQFGPWVEQVTIYHLLTHTSGLPHQTGEMLFEPGELWSYSNLFGLLSLFVEAATGQSYIDYVVEHILRPAGMTDMEQVAAGLLLDEAAVPAPRIAPTTAPGAGGPGAGGPGAGGPGAGGPGPSGPGAGPGGRTPGPMGADGRTPVGSHWTIRDVQRFAAALLEHELLDPQHLAMMMTGRYDMVGSAMVAYPNARYGFGMVESSVHGVTTYGHSGSGFGVNAILDIYPDQGFVVSILSNYDNGMLLVNDWLRMTIAGVAMPEPVALPLEVVQGFAGRYLPDEARSVPADREARQGPRTPQLLGGPPTFDVTADAEGLWIDFGSAALRRYLPLSDDTFFDREDPAARLTFERDEAGNVTTLQSTNTRHFDGMGAGWYGDVVATRQR